MPHLSGKSSTRSPTSRTPIPDLVALAYPAHWGTYKQALIAGALRAAGLAEVLLVTEPAAAITDAALPAAIGVQTVLVYDFGGGSFDAAVMTRSATGEFAAVGIPQGLDWLGGDDFDQAIFSRVRDGVRLTDTVPADPEILTQMSRLREACTQAKETLSLDTEVTIPVATTRYRTRFRLVRAEFDELIRDAIDDTLDAAKRVIGSAGLAVADLDAIVLVGGTSRIPLVAQMISAEFSLPIIVDPRPEDSIALGAARLAVECLQARQAALLPIPLVQSLSCKSPPSNHPSTIHPSSNRTPLNRPFRRCSCPRIRGLRSSAMQCRPHRGRPSEPTTSTRRRRSQSRMLPGSSHRTSLTAGPVATSCRHQYRRGPVTNPRPCERPVRTVVGTVIGRAAAMACGWPGSLPLPPA